MSGFDALVPVKRLALAKQRLRGVLGADARAALMADMLDKVLGAVAGAARVRRAFVVTSDPEAIEIGRRHGADSLPDAGLGLNAALAAAVEARRAAGSRAFALVQADLPWLTAPALDQFLTLVGEDGQAAIAPDHHEMGTSVLAWRGDPGLTSFAFGSESLSAHLAIARSAGLEISVFGPRLAFHDLDDPDDLFEFERAGRAAG